MTEPTSADQQADHLQVLSDEQCLELLTGRHFGRIGFVADGWSVILPVNYVFEEPSIVVRTGSGTKLEETPLAMVAFEIDDADPHGRWGWSVLAQGPAFDITGALDQYSEVLRDLPVHPAAPGEKPNWLKISARRISGRRFGEAPLP